MENLKEYFDNPKIPKQKQYEVIRGFVKEGISISELSERFGYTKNTIYSLIRDLKAGKLELFALHKPGPKHRRIDNKTKLEIIKLRLRDYSYSAIKTNLEEMGIVISIKTIERVLSDAGFAQVKYFIEDKTTTK